MLFLAFIASSLRVTEENLLFEIVQSSLLLKDLTFVFYSKNAYSGTANVFVPADKTKNTKAKDSHTTNLNSSNKNKTN